MKELNITKKRASNEAYNTLLPETMEWAMDFFSQTHPLGVVGVQQDCLIDINKASIAFDTVEIIYGYSHTTVHVQRIGNYVKGQKITVILTMKPGDLTIAPHRDGLTPNPRR